MSTSPPPLSHAGPAPLLTPTEQEVLEAYQRLLNNMNKLASSINSLAENPPQQMLDSLRQLERKSGLVFTLFKTSVYRLMLQHQFDEEEDHGDGDETAHQDDHY